MMWFDLIQDLAETETASPATPYQGLDPNSQHQMWSRWIFGIHADTAALSHDRTPRMARRPSVREVSENARRYFTKLLRTTVGRLRCEEQDGYYVITLEVEGVAAHDPDFQASVRRDVVDRFIGRGFGTNAILSRYTVGILAGDRQTGGPPDQLLVIPGQSETRVYGRRVKE